MKVTITANPWTLPGPPVYLEGRPSPEELAHNEALAEASRSYWEPSPEAFALLERLREMVDLEVVIQGWDPIMFYLEEDGPYPIRATCVDVITREDATGKLRAYLALKNPVAVPTRDGYDGSGQLVPENDLWLFGLDRLYEIETEANT